MHHPKDRIAHDTAFVTPGRGALAGTRNSSSLSVKNIRLMVCSQLDGGHSLMIEYQLKVW